MTKNVKVAQTGVNNVFFRNNNKFKSVSNVHKATFYKMEYVSHNVLMVGDKIKYAKNVNILVKYVQLQIHVYNVIKIIIFSLKIQHALLDALVAITIHKKMNRLISHQHVKNVLRLVDNVSTKLNAYLAKMNIPFNNRMVGAYLNKIV